MKSISPFITLTLLALCLPSCIGIIVDAVGPKPAFTGPKPPSVVVLDGSHNSGKWLNRDPYELPASSDLINKPLKHAKDGIPYGFESPYRNCVHSPYNPFSRLDITGLNSGQKVYDPYNRQPFYIP